MKMKIVMVTAFLAAGLAFGGKMEAQAAPVTMPDGTVFDPDYYAQMNPDVVITVGTEPMALYLHYVEHGQKEGRLPAAPADIISNMDPTVFDPAYYAGRYPDVTASFGSDVRILQWHYEYWGKAEGRFPNIAAENMAVQAQAAAQRQSAQQGTAQKPQQTTQQQTAQQSVVKNLYIHDVYDLVNSERKKADRDKLTWSDGLQAAADIRAREIAVYMSHERPDGSKYYTVVEDADANKLTEVYGRGEPTPEDIVDYWMKDSGYRTSLMNDKSKKMGVGYYNVNGVTFWVALLWQNK